MSKHVVVDTLARWLRATGMGATRFPCCERSGPSKSNPHELQFSLPARSPFGDAGLALILLLKEYWSFSARHLACRMVAVWAFAIASAAPRLALSAFECKDESWQGTSELLSIAREIAGANRVRLVAELDYSELTATDSVLILHPEVILDDVSLIAFIQHGGRAAVLDDFGKSLTFIERFGIRRVPAPADPQLALRDNRHLPIGTPVESASTSASTSARHPLIAEVERIVLNHPSGLTNPGLTPLLEVRAKNGAAIPIALTGVIGDAPQGRLLVMSDPSALINLMIRYPGNMTFARALIRYLSEDDGKTGGGRLYVVSNRFDQTGRFSRSHGVFADLTEALEQLVRKLQNGVPPQLLILLAALSTLWIGRWIAANAWHRSATALPRYLRPAPEIAQAGWPGRVAALVAPTTHPALLLLEFREAFRLRLAHFLAVSPSASSQELIETAESRKVLPPTLLHSLRSLMATVDIMEKAVAARKPVRIKQSRVAALLQQGLDILEHFSQLERPGRESSPPSQ